MNTPTARLRLTVSTALALTGCRPSAQASDRTPPGASGAPHGDPDVVAVCDTVLDSWRTATHADIRLADTTVQAASEALPLPGCMVIASAPVGIDSVQRSHLYWAMDTARDWTELLAYMADGPDGGSRTVERDAVRCQIDFTRDGGDDSDSTYVPSPAIGETTFCWRHPT